MVERATRYAVPDERGFFGEHGGQFLPPELEIGRASCRERV